MTLTQQAPDRAVARDLTDRLGEALRRYRYGLIRPLWADLKEETREWWRGEASFFVLRLADVGLKVEIAP